MNTSTAMTFEQRYQATRESSVTLKQPPPAILSLSGPDAMDLLNRMSTNAMPTTGARGVHNTVFTNANARIIDIATVIPGGAEYFLLSWRHAASTLLQWLSGYIFFQDNVRVQESTLDWALFDFLGPQSDHELQIIAAFDDYNGESYYAVPGGFLWSEPLGKVKRSRLLCHGSLAQQLSTPGQDTHKPSQDDPLSELLRIEAGRPRIGSEITHDTIPLEVGLGDYVSFSKGCYIGQEIIARMESRGKLARTLTGVRLDQQAAPRTDLIQNGRVIGSISSCAHSPRFGWIGLASVKPASILDPATITLGASSAVARLQSLPFE